MPHSLSERLNNLYWERKLGISTQGLHDTDFPDANHYATMCYSTINRVLQRLFLAPSDILVDIGCGKGRVLCCAARLHVRKVIGVEISEELSQVAEENASRMHDRRSPIEVMNVRAQDFDYGEATVMMLFNPFGPTTVEAVLDRMRVSRNSHSVRIAYINPVHERIFLDKRWLKLIEHWDQDRMQTEHSVSFYKSRMK